VSESTGPYSLWTGSDRDLEFSGGTAYMLVSGGAPAEGAPRHLGIANVDSAERARAMLRETARADLVWRMLWTRVSRFGEPAEPARYLFMVGMDPAPGSDADARAEFDRFYTDVHVPEVVAAGGYLCGTRLRRLGEPGAPTPTRPEFCAVYDADEAAGRAKLASFETRSTGRPRAAYSEGPPSWQGRTTAWRLLYRRVTP
jgi:hypothetical protein